MIASWTRATAVRRTKLMLAVVAAVLILVGCGPRLYEPIRVATQQDAASVTMAVTMVQGWEEVIGDLEPQFARLTGDAALERVIPATSRLEERLVDTLAARLAIGLPQTSRTVTRTTTREGEAQTFAEQTQRTLQPGTAPAAEVGAAGATGAGQLQPALPSDLRQGLGEDPMLQHAAAAALIQEVVLLNRAVRSAAVRHRMKPYVVRLQIGVRPYLRRLPYDTWLDLAFFTGNDDELAALRDLRQQAPQALAPPYVLPILVTDNLEGQARGRTTEVVRQFALAASALAQGIAVNAGLQTSRDELRALAGTDLNSVLSLGRLVDNVVQVRLGAALQPGAGFGMVPRTHNVTLLVLVPDDYVLRLPTTSPSSHNSTMMPSLQVAMTSRLRDAETGIVLPQRGVGPETLARLRGIIPAPVEAALTSDSAFREAVVTSVQRGDMPAYFRAVCRVEGPGASTSTPAARSDCGPVGATISSWILPLWSALADVSGRGDFHAATLQLPNQLRPELPEAQTVLLRSAGEFTVASVGGVHGLDPGAYRAELDVVVAGRERKLVSRGITADTSTSSLSASFPSIEVLRASTSGRPAPLGAIKLRLIPLAQAPWQRAGRPPTFELGDVRYAGPDAQLRADFRLSASADAVAVATDGAATLRLLVRAGSAREVTVTPRNAIITGVRDVSGSGASARVVAGSLVLRGSGPVDVLMTALVPGRQVTLEAEGTAPGRDRATSTLAVAVEKRG